MTETDACYCVVASWVIFLTVGVVWYAFWKIRMNTLKRDGTTLEELKQKHIDDGNHWI